MSDKIIVALDMPTLAEAKTIVDALPQAGFFKVGLQAYLAFGEAIIGYLQERGKKLFLDLKLHDIPNTVAGAIGSVLRHRPAFLTLHLCGGGEMVKRALDAASANPDLTLLGVTVLTSLADADLMEIGFCHSARNTVVNLFHLGQNAGLKGFVCSPEEVRRLRKEGGMDPILVTPGIRPASAERDDQKRFFTPAEAMAAGSNFLVIGRPITHDPSPAEAFTRIAAEVAKAMSANSVPDD